MPDKAYIVANEQQEREVLEKLEQVGHTWTSGRKPTDWVPSKNILGLIQFPYALLDRGNVVWRALSQLIDEKIVFDGRKEEHMSDKYVVSQEFMNKLNEWKEAYITDTLDEKYHYVSAGDLDTLPGMIKDWWIGLNKPTETNNRLIAIIRWVNGEDVFEVEKPKKWVVRSKEHDEGGHYQYVKAGKFDMSFNEYHIEHATRFDTKEEAQEWANTHQEVVEVVDV